MTIKTMFDGAKYIAEVDGDRVTYYVFGTNNNYLVASPSNRGGLNVNVVDREAPDVIKRRFGGERVTGKRLSQESRRPDLFKDRFDSLGSLYVMVALGKARKLKVRDGRSLVFKIK